MTGALAFPTLSPARRWHIVLARDRRFDGAFVYAVRSTGIYCRPSCPSRRPRRELVTFFPIPEAAEQAGFRPCRRCSPTSVNGAHPDMALVRETCGRLDSHPDEPATLAALSARTGTSPRRLLRAFRAVLGVTPRQYRDARRLERFKRQLHERRRVSPATYAARYGSSSRVYQRAGAQLGITPPAYSRGGPGARLAVPVVPCPLGRLPVPATQPWICPLRVRARAPGLTARGRAPDLDPPLEVRATAFQRAVWEALRKIPYGSTRSYAEIARAIGRPRATRAVARACATNPAAIVIPCHRVVRADGDLGGYRWGIRRKRALIEGERATKANR